MASETLRERAEQILNRVRSARLDYELQSEPKTDDDEPDLLADLHWTVEQLLKLLPAEEQDPREAAAGRALGYTFGSSPAPETEEKP